MQMSRTEATRAALANSVGTSGQADVNSSVSAIVDNTNTVNHGVAVRALTSNTDTVWVGLESSTSATNGVALNPGEGVTLKIDQLAKVFAFAATGTQKVSYVAT